MLILGWVGRGPLVWCHESLQTRNYTGHDAVANFDLRTTGSGCTDEGGIRGEDLSVEIVEPEAGESDDTEKGVRLASNIRLGWRIDARKTAPKGCYYDRFGIDVHLDSPYKVD